MLKIPGKLERRRVTSGPMGSDTSHGANGAFVLQHMGQSLTIIVSNGDDWADCGYPPPAWEHVSVSCLGRCPTWEEMDYVKRLVWEPDDVAIQLHVAESDHVNYHPTCLHMWRPIGVDLPLPPGSTVGP